MKTDPGLMAMLEQIWQILRRINQRTKNIMASQEDEAAQLSKIGDQLDKATGEITSAIQQLKDALASAGSTTPAVDAAVARLTTIAQGLDDIVPDAPAPTSSGTSATT